MGDNSGIEWTESTWNPITGCTKITAGCDNCYAHRFAERFRGVPGHPFFNGFDLTLKPDRLDQPVRWKRPRMIFVNSMSDLFHKGVPDAYVDSVFDVMEATDRHVYQILTKRSSRMRDYVSVRYQGRPAPAHIWLGVSVEDVSSSARLRHLRETPAMVRFVSAEPLLGPLGAIDLSGVSWLIAGGESGPHHRLMHADWVREIRDQCIRQDVAFFFKQWGGFRPKSLGKTIDGREWCEMPRAVAA